MVDDRSKGSRDIGIGLDGAKRASGSDRHADVAKRDTAVEPTFALVTPDI